MLFSHSLTLFDLPQLVGSCHWMKASKYLTTHSTPDIFIFYDIESFPRKQSSQILTALEYVHSLRLIHCDLKPAGASEIRYLFHFTSCITLTSQMLWHHMESLKPRGEHFDQVVQQVWGQGTPMLSIANVFGWTVFGLVICGNVYVQCSMADETSKKKQQRLKHLSVFRTSCFLTGHRLWVFLLCGRPPLFVCAVKIVPCTRGTLCRTCLFFPTVLDSFCLITGSAWAWTSQCWLPIQQLSIEVILYLFV